MLFVVSTMKKLLEEKKELQKTNQREFRTEKVIKKKGYMSNKKVMILHLIVGFLEKILMHKMRYFTPYGHSKN